MKLSLCPRSSFPAPVAQPAPPRGEVIDAAAWPRVEAVPPRKGVKPKAWLQHEMRRDGDSES